MILNLETRSTEAAPSRCITSAAVYQNCALLRWTWKPRFAYAFMYGETMKGEIGIHDLFFFQITLGFQSEGVPLIIMSCRRKL
jgi:hypothetical protein